MNETRGSTGDLAEEVQETPSSDIYSKIEIISSERGRAVFRAESEEVALVFVRGEGYSAKYDPQEGHYFILKVMGSKTSRGTIRRIEESGNEIFEIVMELEMTKPDLRGYHKLFRGPFIPPYTSPGQKQP